jgi:hypothetical protein
MIKIMCLTSATNLHDEKKQNENSKWIHGRLLSLANNQINAN